MIILLTLCFYAAGTDHASAERERAVIRARQLPVDRRLVNFFVSETVLRRSSLWSKCPLALSTLFHLTPDNCFYPGDMAGGVANDPFTAYQEAVKVMSAKKGSSSRRASVDEVMITGSRHSTVVK